MTPLVFIDTASDDPAFNLACEEFFLTHGDHGRETVFLLYENRECTVSGKFQNIFGEINSAFTETRGIPAYRRETGGGTVVHGKGNLNFSFIGKSVGPFEESYGYSSSLVIGALSSLGVKAYKDQTTDIFTDTPDGRRKISGNAQCVKNGAFLCHGTLLYDADIGRLEKILKKGPGSYASKAVRSNPAKTANVRPLVPSSPDTRTFSELFKAAVCESGNGRTLTEEEKSAARDLARRKYSSNEWTYGRSPKFSFSSASEGGYVEINAECGIITDVRASEDLEFLVGTPFGYKSIKENIASRSPDGKRLAELFSKLIFGGEN